MRTKLPEPKNSLSQKVWAKNFGDIIETEKNLNIETIYTPQEREKFKLEAGEMPNSD
jgi:hypothetical protein